MQSVSFFAHNKDDTYKLANKLAETIAGKKACIELVGDVGAGKTTFTQALVGALGSGDTVTSPTFTIENVYQADKNTVHHFDLYRLQEAGLIPEEVNEALQDGNSIVIIEWADILDQNRNLPDDRIVIRFEPHASSETARKITVLSPKLLSLVATTGEKE